MTQDGGQTAVLFEVDNASWETLINRAGKWFLNVQMIQTSLRKLVEDTLPKISDSSVHLYLKSLHEIAVRHEAQVADLLRMVEREPSAARSIAGSGVAKSRELWADAIVFREVLSRDGGIFSRSYTRAWTASQHSASRTTLGSLLACPTLRN